MITIKRKITKDRAVKAKGFFYKNGILQKSSDLVILGKEQNSYEIMKKKTERLLRILDKL